MFSVSTCFLFMSFTHKCTVDLESHRIMKTCNYMSSWSWGAVIFGNVTVLKSYSHVLWSLKQISKLFLKMTDSEYFSIVLLWWIVSALVFPQNFLFCLYFWRTFSWDMEFEMNSFPFKTFHHCVLTFRREIIAYLSSPVCSVFFIPSADFKVFSISNLMVTSLSLDFFEFFWHRAHWTPGSVGL